MLEFLVGLAQSKAGAISRITGKSENEIKKAIEQGKKYLPEIQNSKDGGRSLIKQLGIERGFIDDMYKKYGHYADRIPGVGRMALDSAYRSLVTGLDAPGGTDKKDKNGFDKKKYKRV